MRVILLCMAVCACTISSAQMTTSSVTLPSPPDVLVTTQPSCPAEVANCDIVEILDLHTHANSEDKGFDELRSLARARGGDAVIGAEFEHGDETQRSHLSGVIVKRGAPVPAHTVLGELEVNSDPDDKRKGLEELMARAYAMGGDQVIAVTFEHGEDGASGRLHGRVIRFRR